MPTKTKINVRLLRRIQKQIAKEPKQFRMDRYFQHYPGSIPNCGTACCIGGWAITLGGKFKTPEQARMEASDVHWSAKDALGLTIFQAARLFHLSNWPEPFRHEFFDARTLTQKAKVAIARIDRFIATKGAE